MTAGRGAAPPALAGRVGATLAESEPWWPDPVSPPLGSPNIVMIVLDDVGFADLGCYGSEIETPVLDALAADGVRFTNFHTTPVCSPTRAALLTGRNPHSVGMGVVSSWDTGFPGYRGRIAASAATLGEMLNPMGYGTYAVGKWHLAPLDETSAAGPFHNWPLGKGFDRYYGFLDGGTNLWAPDLVADNHHISPPEHPDYHCVADLVDQAVRFVDDHTSIYPDDPFFLYVAFPTGHYPLHAPSAAIDKYRGRFAHGWDESRVRRLERQKELGIVPAETELPEPNPGVRPWADLADDERRLAERLQEAYAGMLDYTDAELGRLIEALVSSGNYDNTIFVVVSDNGATAEGGDLGFDNHLRQINGLGARPTAERLDTIEAIGGPDSSPIYPAGWAMAGNTPLKWYKQHTHGGGVRDPLIVAWHDGVAARGEVRDQYHHVSDVTPTILDLLGAEPPSVVAGVPQQPLEGTSMAYALADASAPTAKQVQHYEMFGHRGIWSDGWKAVTCHERTTSFDDDVWELYHLDADFSECNDLARHDPERLAALVDLWWREAEAHQVLPLDDRILERFHVPKPRRANGRRSFSYRPGLYAPFEASPPTLGVSYTLTVDARHSERDQGVLVACGDRFGGYSLFVQDGRLVHDYNCGGTHTVVESTVPLPEGDISFRYSFTQTGWLQGVGRLLVDGRVVAEAMIETTAGIHINAIGVSVGWNRLSPVSRRYEGSFRYTGELHVVRFELGDDRQLPGLDLDQLFD